MTVRQMALLSRRTIFSKLPRNSSKKRLIAQQQASVNQRRADDGIVASELHGVDRFANARTELQTDVEDALRQRAEQFGDLFTPHRLVEEHQIDVGVWRALPPAVAAQADNGEIRTKFVGFRSGLFERSVEQPHDERIDQRSELRGDLRSRQAAVMDRADFGATSVQLLLERLQSPG